MGEKLIQDIPNAPLTASLGRRHNPKDSTVASTGHQISILPNSVLANILGFKDDEKHIIWVNTYHHQGLFDIAHPKSFEIDAYDAAPLIGKDTGLIEAFAAKRNQFALAVQWHPERPQALSSDQNPMFILDPKKLLPRHERSHNRAIFSAFLTCARKEKECSNFISRKSK